MILKAAWVVPIGAAPIRDGCVEIAGSRIVAVGPAAGVGSGRAEVVDLGGAVLTPGLVNPHTHLELSCYVGRLRPGPFWSWVERLVRLRSRWGQSWRERRAVRRGAWQSLRAGVTCVGDISRRNAAWPVLKRIPVRKVCFVELLSIAHQPPRNLAELRQAVASVVEDELLTVGISPHAPYSVPREQIRDALRLADELGRPWTMHLAETAEEVAFLAGAPVELAPVVRKLLARHGIVSPRQSVSEFLADCAGGCRPGLLAHMNYVRDEELASLAAARHAVVYCPRAHHFFGHPPHPFVRMRAAGLTVALGTDSLASNSSLSPLDELRFVHARVADAPPPEQLLRMVTLDAARALGLDEQIGSLEPGKQADLAAFPLNAAADNPLRALIAEPTRPLAVWVAGKKVV